MSLYAKAYNNSITGPYLAPVHARVSRFKTGAASFNRGASRFYTRGVQVGGVKSGLIQFLIDLAHLALLAGGVYFLITSLLG